MANVDLGPSARMVPRMTDCRCLRCPGYHRVGRGGFNPGCSGWRGRGVAAGRGCSGDGCMVGEAVSIHCGSA